MKTKLQILAAAILLAAATLSCSAAPPATNNAPVPIPVPTTPIALQATTPAVSGDFDLAVLQKGNPADTNWTTQQIVPVFRLGWTVAFDPDTNPAALYHVILSNDVNSAYGPYSAEYTNQPVYHALTNNASIIGTANGLTPK